MAYTLKKTIHNSRLVRPWEYKVTCGKETRIFRRGEERMLGAFVLDLWKHDLPGIHLPAYVYFQYDTGYSALYAKYEVIAE